MGIKSFISENNAMMETRTQEMAVLLHVLLKKVGNVTILKDLATALKFAEMD